MHVAYLKAKIFIHSAWEAQIALLLAKKVIILDKYWDFANIFLKKLAAKLLERFGINKYAIELKLD